MRKNVISAVQKVLSDLSCNIFYDASSNPREKLQVV